MKYNFNNLFFLLLFFCLNNSLFAEFDYKNATISELVKFAQEETENFNQIFLNILQENISLGKAFKEEVILGSDFSKILDNMNYKEFAPFVQGASLSVLKELKYEQV